MGLRVFGYKAKAGGHSRFTIVDLSLLRQGQATATTMMLIMMTMMTIMMTMMMIIMMMMLMMAVAAVRGLNVPNHVRSRETHLRRERQGTPTSGTFYSLAPVRRLTWLPFWPSTLTCPRRRRVLQKRRTRGAT